MTREPWGRGAEWSRSRAQTWTGAQEPVPSQPPEARRGRHAGWASPEVPARPGTWDSRAAGEVAAPGRDPGEYDSAAEGGSEELWAMLSYLGAIFLWLLAPLAIYLAKRRKSRYVRCHAAQALNLMITTTLFGVACAIVGGLLALDTPATGLAAMIFLLCTLWLAMLTYLVRAVIAASRGEFYEVPDWLCMRVIR